MGDPTPRAVIDESAFPILDASELAALDALGTRRRMEAGEYLYREGDTAYDFYVVLSGILTASQATLGARGVLRPGDYFGEVAPAMGVPRTATVRAMTPATIASCDRATFDEIVKPLFAD